MQTVLTINDQPIESFNRFNSIHSISIIYFCKYVSFTTVFHHNCHTFAFISCIQRKMATWNGDIYLEAENRPPIRMQFLLTKCNETTWKYIARAIDVQLQKRKCSGEACNCFTRWIISTRISFTYMAEEASIRAQHKLIDDWTRKCTNWKDTAGVEKPLCVQSTVWPFDWFNYDMSIDQTTKWFCAFQTGQRSAGL